MTHAKPHPNLSRTFPGPRWRIATRSPHARRVSAVDRRHSRATREPGGPRCPSPVEHRMRLVAAIIMVQFLRRAVVTHADAEPDAAAASGPRNYFSERPEEPPPRAVERVPRGVGGNHEKPNQEDQEEGPKERHPYPAAHSEEKADRARGEQFCCRRRELGPVGYLPRRLIGRPRRRESAGYPGDDGKEQERHAQSAEGAEEDGQGELRGLPHGWTCSRPGSPSGRRRPASR